MKSLCCQSDQKQRDCNKDPEYLLKSKEWFWIYQKLLFIYNCYCHSKILFYSRIQVPILNVDINHKFIYSFLIYVVMKSQILNIWYTIKFIVVTRAGFRNIVCWPVKNFENLHGVTKLIKVATFWISSVCLLELRFCINFYRSLQSIHVKQTLMYNIWV